MGKVYINVDKKQQKNTKKDNKQLTLYLINCIIIMIRGNRKMSLNIEGNNALLYTDIEEEVKIDENKKTGNKKIIYRALKRFIDIMGGLVGVVILIPMTIVLFIVSKISKSDRGPLFYEQLRLGKNGKHFRIFKYRTMIVGADKILEQYLAENEEARIEFEKNQKLENDPRITKLGDFLRKTSIDEFPQFINVLKGNMSLIGPRPIVDREIPLFGDKMEIVHSVKPGITGYWGVNGRSNTTYEERVEMEAYYAENFSLWLDIKIFFKTIISILKRDGAK